MEKTKKIIAYRFGDGVFLKKRGLPYRVATAEFQAGFVCPVTALWHEKGTFLLRMENNSYPYTTTGGYLCTDWTYTHCVDAKRLLLAFGASCGSRSTASLLRNAKSEAEFARKCADQERWCSPNGVSAAGFAATWNEQEKRLTELILEVIK